MKQGRRAREGANRQEGEKPWRRSVVGSATPGVGSREGPRGSPLLHTLEGRTNLMEGTAKLQRYFCGRLQVVKL
jgi:hypothetical protein